MNVLHVATLNRPIKQNLGYGPIETVVYNIDKGLHELGYRSIVACSGDSNVVGEQYTTIAKSFGQYWAKDTHVQRKHMRQHLSLALQRARRGDIDIIHMHDPVMMEYMFKGVLKHPVPIVMTLMCRPRKRDSSSGGMNRSFPLPVHILSRLVTTRNSSIKD